VTHLLATGGLVPGVEERSDALTPRQKGIRLGAKLLFASVISFPLVIAASAASDSPAPLLITVMLFLIGVSRMAYARMFEPGPRGVSAVPHAIEPPRQQSVLPAYQAPVSVGARGRTTGELAEPPSVTEHTTRLLDH
jgi:hypothetical protein